jgi:OOP family OmpA-OmpF porin
MKKTQRLAAQLFIAVASLAAVAGAHAQASSKSMYAPGGSYIGLAAGESDFSLGNGTGLFGSDNKDTSYSIRAGGYFTSNLGMEIGYTDFGSVSRAGGSTKADGFNVSLIGKLPVSPSFNLLGKIGTTYGRTDVSARVGSGVASGSESGWGLAMGLGAEYMITPQWSAVLQYETHDMKFAGSDNQRVNTTNLGVRYNF